MAMAADSEEEFHSAAEDDPGQDNKGGECASVGDNNVVNDEKSDSEGVKVELSEQEIKVLKQ